MTLTCKIYGARDLRLEDTASTELGATDVELRLGAGGICGSDLHYFQHGRVGSFVVREPLIPGHEASGIVARIGASVSRVKVGDKVAINPSHACGQCDYCLGGRFNLCRKMRFLGSASVFPHVQGMFSERFTMGERQLTPIHEDISLGELACAEPLSIGLHAVHRAGALLGKTVLVMRRNHRLHECDGRQDGRRGASHRCRHRAACARRGAPGRRRRMRSLRPCLGTGFD